MKRSFIFSLALICAGFVILKSAHTAVPQLINYQGRMTHIAGDPLDTTVSITFTIYDDATSGSAVWTETQAAVTVTEGLFNVPLGSVTPLVDSVFGDTSRYLGVQIGGDTELSPRTRLVSAGYAFRIGTIDGATGGTITGDVDIQSKLTVDSASAGDAQIAGNLTVSGNIIGSTSWTSLPLGAGYQDEEDAHPGGWQRVEYRKIGDIVYLRGLLHKIDHAAIPSNTVVAILPAGFRPPEIVGFSMASNWRVDVRTSGDIFPSVATGSELVFLDGITFSTSP